MRMDVEAVRRLFAQRFSVKAFTGNTLELVAVTFEANGPFILGAVNQGYVERELDWYLSHSLNVNDIPGGPPEIWKRVATPEGFINSNYGYLVFSRENGNQYDHVVRELIRDPTSRRAIIVYTRPTMHVDQNRGGMQDFVCTNTVQYLIRDGRLIAHVSMRSNDAWAGYRNDWAWQNYVHKRLAEDIDVPMGPLYWTAGSLHFYDRQYYLIDMFIRRDKTCCTPSEYEREFPDSPYIWWRK